MGAVGVFFLSTMQSQYASTAKPITRSSGCSWTSAANGAALSTGGRIHPTPDQVHELVDRTEETDPGSPGWSVPDVDRAMARLGVPFDNRSGQGWPAAVAAWNAGMATLIQGDSDRFADATCSGVFNGDHAILVHPAFRIVDGRRQRLIADPICKAWRWEFESVIRAYATKLNAGIRFGVFTTPVPKTASPRPAPPVTLRYGGRRLSPAQAKRIAVPSGHRANERTAPRTTARVVARLANRTLFTAAQVTRTGSRPAGSSSTTWYGDRSGTRWLHSTAF